MKEEEIGKVFSEKLANYRQLPPEGLWADIQNDAALLKFNRTRRLRKIAFRTAVSVAVIAIVAIGLFVFLHKDNENTDNQLVNKIEKSENMPNGSIVLTEKESPKTTSSSYNAVPEQTAVAPTESPLVLNPGQSVLDEAPALRSEEVKPLPIEVSPVVQPMASTPTAPSMAMPATQYPITPSVASNHHSRGDEWTSPSMTPDNRLKTSELRHSRDTMVCRNSKVVLFVENALDVRWSTGHFGNTIEIYPEESVQLYADLTRYDKTDTTIYLRIDVYDCDVFVPSAFTPNGDGLNDEFIVHAPMDITGFELVIFDKMSRVLFQTKSIYQGWDGTFEGKVLPQGAYFYVISYRDSLNEKHLKKGQIVLVR